MTEGPRSWYRTCRPRAATLLATAFAVVTAAGAAPPPEAGLSAQDDAARLAQEMGADIVKPHEPTEDNDRSPEPYRSLEEDAPAWIQRVARSAGRAMVLFSGGVKQDDDARVLSRGEAAPPLREGGGPLARGPRHHGRLSALKAEQA